MLAQQFDLQEGKVWASSRFPALLTVSASEDVAFYTPALCTY